MIHAKYNIFLADLTDYADSILGMIAATGK